MKEQSWRLYRLAFPRVSKILPTCPQVLEFGFDLWLSWKTRKRRHSIIHWLSIWHSPVCCLFQRVHKISCSHEMCQNDVYFEQKYTTALFRRQKTLSARNSSHDISIKKLDNKLTKDEVSTNCNHKAQIILFCCEEKHVNKAMKPVLWQAHLSGQLLGTQKG